MPWVQLALWGMGERERERRIDRQREGERDRQRQRDGERDRGNNTIGSIFLKVSFYKEITKKKKNKTVSTYKHG